MAHDRNEDIELKSPNPRPKPDSGSPKMDDKRTERPSAPGKVEPSGAERDIQVGDPQTEIDPESPRYSWVAPPDFKPERPKEEEEKDENAIIRRPSAPGSTMPSGDDRFTQVGDPVVKPQEMGEDGKPVTVPMTRGLTNLEFSPPVFKDMAAPRAQPPSALPLDQEEKQLVKIKLFQSFHEGSGYGDETPMDRIDPTKGSAHYNRGYGSIDARWPGQLRVGQRVVKLAATNHDVNPVFAIEWTDDNLVNPAIRYIVGKKVMQIRFGVVTEPGNADMNSLATVNATDGMFHDNAGTPGLYACFGSSQNIVLMLSNYDFSIDSSGVKADKLLSINGDAYRTVIPTGSTVHSAVSKLPYGSNPFSLTLWGSDDVVGFAGTRINVLTAVRNAPVAIKPEGVFAYNAGLNRWVNYTPSWRTFMHFDNGKGAFHLGDALIIPMGDGSTMIFDGNNVRPFDPGGPLATPNRHTTRDDFVNGTMMSMRHWVMGVTGNFSKIISGGDTVEMRVYDDSGATFQTDDSSDIRDLDLTTNMTVLIDASDVLYVGWTRPFTAVQFSFSTVNSTTSRVMSVAVGTTAGSPGTYTDVGAVNTGFRDFTTLATASMGQGGQVAMMVDPTQVGTGWVKTTVDGSELYWMRFTFSGALSNTVIVHARISPWYPSIDNTNFPLDGLDRSGILPHVMYGRMGANGQPWFHDMVSLPEPDHIGAALFANVGGTNVNHPRRTLLIGRFAVWAIDVPDNDRPGYEPEPYLNDVGLIESTSFIPVPGKVVRLNKIIINGHEFTSDVKTFMYYGWDYGHPMSRMTGAMITVPSVIEFRDPHDKGTRFRWAWGYTTSSVNTAKDNVPVVTSIEAEFEVLGDQEPDMTPERPIQDTPRN